MSKEKKAPKQTDFKQPYGEPIMGSKKVKNKNHTRQKKGAHHDM